MKVKCYAIYENGSEVVSEYANPSQKNFLSFQLANTSRKFKRSDRIEFEHTSNGVWYCKLSDKTGRTHLTLLASEAASLPVASNLLSKGLDFDANNTSQQKLRMKLAEQIKIINANAKVDAINSNVIDLENIMKGNVSKIMNNMSDLETAEKKSERLSSLSMQFQTDSRSLKEKLERKACIRKLVMGGVGGALIVFLIYYFFM